MLETRLIFVEGLAGSGKSTTARHLVAQLAQAQLAARLFSEHQQDHPLNVGGPLHPAGTTTGEELFRRYTVEAYVAESLERWRAFVATAAAVETVSVLDSYQYQNAARVLFQMDSSIEVIQPYAREIEVLTQPLAPVLIYLRSSPSLEGLTPKIQARGQAWLDSATEIAETGRVALAVSTSQGTS